MLPVIDLVNLMDHLTLPMLLLVILAAVLDDDDNDFSTSLISTRDIQLGEELLFDCGGGGSGTGGGDGGGGDGEKKKISNDGLLVDYGFVLPKHTDRVSITLGEFQVAISELDLSMMMREGMSKVPEGDKKELDTLVTFLIRQTTTELGTQPLLFFVAPNGEPTPQTLAITLVMTCRDHDDVTRVLTPAHGIKTQHDAALLPNQIIDSCTDLQREFARYALKRAVGLALIHRAPIITTTENEHDDDDDSSSCDEVDNKGSFANIAREYSIMCREMLKDVADMSR